MKKFAWLYILLGLSVLTAHAVELTNTNPRPTAQTATARGNNATGYLNQIRVSDIDATDAVSYIAEQVTGHDNVQADWNVTNTDSDAFIKNKPHIPTIPSDAAIGDKAFSNPPEDLSSTEKLAVRNAIGAAAPGQGGGGGGGGEENVQADWSETDSTNDAFIKNKPTIPQEENLVPFAETFSQAFARTFESTFNANNANTAAISSNNNVPSGAPSGTTDFLVMTQPPALQAGDWFRAERGNNYIITKIQFIDVTNAGDSRFWFNPSTDIADTLKFDSLGTGAGTIRFAKQAMARDASNADSDAYSNLAGYDEPVILTGYTRVSANVLTGSGEWFFSGNAGTSLIIWPKANEKMALIARLKSGHFIKFGSYLLVLSSNASLYNNQYTITATRVSGTIPGLNSSSILTALGDNIHRNEVSAAALKATLPAGGQYLRVKSDGSDVEGVSLTIPPTYTISSQTTIGTSNTTFISNGANGQLYEVFFKGSKSTLDSGQPFFDSIQLYWDDIPSGTSRMAPAFTSRLAGSNNGVAGRQ